MINTFLGFYSFTSLYLLNTKECKVLKKDYKIYT